MEAFACSGLYLVCQYATKWFELWTNGSKLHDTQMATHIHHNTPHEWRKKKLTNLMNKNYTCPIDYFKESFSHDQ